MLQFAPNRGYLTVSTLEPAELAPCLFVRILRGLTLPDELWDLMLAFPIPAEEDLVRSALLRRQYFPNIKTKGEEFPPLFRSVSFSDESAEELSLLSDPELRETRWVELRSCRYDGLHRRLGVPHPVTYARLALHVASNWGLLKSFLGGDRSKVRPELLQDGLLIRMDYEVASEVINRDTRFAQGARFRVESDVSACFPSIYSHAIDWALRGFQVAKSSRRVKCWETDLDFQTRMMHGGETKGVMIGPAVSNVLAEIVLQRVDKELSNKYSFVRYVDDYTAYCAERSEAESFVVDLQRELSKFRLDINNRKTRIVDLREGMGDEWLYEVTSRLPEKWTPLGAVRFMRFCEALAIKLPHASVLKFGVKSILKSRRDANIEPTLLVVDELLRLCDFNPHLAPFLYSELAEFVGSLDDEDRERLARTVAERMIEAAARAETDVVLWHLCTAVQVLEGSLGKVEVGKLLDMDDDLVSLALGIVCPNERGTLAAQARSRLYPSELERQAHWLSRYELRRADLIDDSDLSDSEKKWMAVLIGHNVCFSDLT